MNEPIRSLMATAGVDTAGLKNEVEHIAVFPIRFKNVKSIINPQGTHSKGVKYAMFSQFKYGVIK